MHQYYTYDDAGNVLNLRDEPTAEHLQADVQCFTYDHMRRMTGVWTPDATGEEACADRPSIAVSEKAALHDSTGTINLHPEQPTCDSHQGLIPQFSEKFFGVRFNTLRG
ncbi:hypothetical protein ACFV4I_16920 [Nocardiopsis alba]|uniref:hypothetical protein n=1 Tax=Nocardiopsis alba TaxID=53437 RepID=UPI00365A6DD2